MKYKGANEYFDYNQSTGLITVKGKYKPVGYQNIRGYIVTQWNGESYKLHRLAWFCYYGVIPGGEIDHINGVRSDNRIVNLRAVSTQENQKNRRVNKNNTSGVIGISRYSRYKTVKWRVRIKVNGKDIALGVFDDLNNAKAARKKAEIKYGFHENHGRI